MATLRPLASLTLVALVGCCSVLAQEEPDLQAIAADIASNEDALRNYSWDSRVSTAVGGEEKKIDLLKVRYDMDGNLQKTRMGGESNAKKVRGPIRKQRAKKKKKKAEEFAEEVRDQLAKYTEPASLQKAILAAFTKTQDGVFKMQATDVVGPGDSVSLDVVPATRQPMSLEVRTAVEGAPIVLDVVFQKLDDGTNYAARSTIRTEYDDKPVEIVTENFNHMKQGG